MPIGQVKTPHEERLWERAKAAAAKEGKAEDWPLISHIFQSMKKADDDGDGDDDDRPGSLDAVGSVILVDVPAPPAPEAAEAPMAKTTIGMNEQPELVLGSNAMGIIDGGGDRQGSTGATPGFGYPLAEPWRSAHAEAREHAAVAGTKEELEPYEEERLSRAISAASRESSTDLEFRRALVPILYGASLAPGLRRSLMRQALEFHRSAGGGVGAQGGGAGARGGRYFRRIPVVDASGKQGHEYVYSEDEYVARPDAHIDGKAMLHRYLVGRVGRTLDRAGDRGVHPFHFTGLVEQHGSEAVAHALAEHGVGINEHGHVVKRQPSYTKAETGEAHESAVPPGTVRLWNISGTPTLEEKQPDNKWKPVPKGRQSKGPGGTGALPPPRPGPHAGSDKPGELSVTHEVSPQQIKELLDSIRR